MEIKRPQPQQGKAGFANDYSKWLLQFSASRTTSSNLLGARD
jgi:hypothetical protein